MTLGSRRLRPALRELLAEVRAVAEPLSATVYLVGGALRDLMLGSFPSGRTADVDLAVDGDAIALAEALAARRPSEKRTSIRSHRAFGTATLQLGDFRLDLARLRSETYARPGALPKVGPGDLRDDLARRDFTVNAMAWPIAAPHRSVMLGDIVDPFDGQADLRQRLIRVLHRRSFSDDATRILRAIRYEQRLGRSLRSGQGFALEAETERLLRRDVGYLDAISGDRLRRELELTFAEPDPAAVLRRAAALGVLTAIHPVLHSCEGRLDDGWLTAARKAQAPAIVYYCALAWSLSEAEALGRSFTVVKDDSASDGGLADRLNLSRGVRRALADALALRRLLVDRVASWRPELAASELRPSQVYAMLEPFAPDAIAAVLLAVPADVEPRALEWLRWYRRRAPLRPLLSGDDLVRLGVTSGPAVGRLLRALRDAQLDGIVHTRRQAAAWLREVVGSDNRVAISTE